MFRVLKSIFIRLNIQSQQKMACNGYNCEVLDHAWKTGFRFIFLTIFTFGFGYVTSSIKQLTGRIIHRPNKSKCQDI